MGINITGLTITNNEIIIDYKGGSPPPPDITIKGVSLNKGYATLTSEVSGPTSCGQDTSTDPTAHTRARVDTFGAIPQIFYKHVGGTDYNKGSGLLYCDNSCSKYNEYGGGCPIYLDDGSYTNICYKLTSSNNKSITMIPNDTCNGNCINNPNSNGDCTKASPSCMDYSVKGLYPAEVYNNYWETQQEPRNRCPPTIYAIKGEIMTFDEIQKDLKNKFESNTNYTCPHEEVTVGAYAKKVQNGHCDWCSGKNMHFDLQDTKDFRFSDHFKTGEVVKYERITCPNPYKPTPYPKTNTGCDPTKCNSTNYKTNDSCLKAMGGVSHTGEGTCCIITKAWNGTCTMCSGDYTNKPCTT